MGRPLTALHVYSAREVVRIALSRVLVNHFSDAMTAARANHDDPRPGDVVVITRDGNTLALCEKLAPRGACILVLTPMPTLPEEAAFRRAGASGYIPMDLDLGRLIAAIEDAIAARDPGASEG
ncbi:MAG: hypothetical protein AB7P22_17180 [Vicinamibacterales bacterium]